MLSLYLAYLDTEEDKKQFEEIFMSYRKQMVSLAFSILENQEDAEDAIHNVFLRIAQKNWDTVRSIEDKTDLRNYLLKSTKNASLNILKIRSKNNVSLDTIDEFDINGIYNLSDEDFIESICINIEYTMVVEAIKSLKDTYKDVMYYHFVMELPVIKIAKLLGQTVPATQKQLVRGKKLLLNLLGIQGVENNVDEQR